MSEFEALQQHGTMHRQKIFHTTSTTLCMERPEPLTPPSSPEWLPYSTRVGGVTLFHTHSFKSGMRSKNSYAGGLARYCEYFRRRQLALPFRISHDIPVKPSNCAVRYPQASQDRYLDKKDD